MGSNAIKTAAVVLVILALILVFVAYRYGQNLQANAQHAQLQMTQQTQQNPKIKAVVAIKPLIANQKIASGDVKLVEVDVAPADHYSEIEQVVGRTPLLDIDVGTPLVPRLFTENNPLAHSIPDGMQALSLRVDDVVGAGGFVQPGDHVDVLIYLRQQDAGAKNEDHVQTQARVLLKNALVLAYEDRLVPPPEDLTKDQKQKVQDQQKKAHHERTAVLAVPDADTTRVMLGSSLGELRLALLGQHSPLQMPAGNASVAGAPASSASVAGGGAMKLASNTAMPAVVPVNEAMQVADNGKSKTATNNTPSSPDKVITLAELAGIKTTKPKPGQRSPPPPPVYIYRGNKLQSVQP